MLMVAALLESLLFYLFRLQRLLVVLQWCTVHTRDDAAMKFSLAKNPETIFSRVFLFLFLPPSPETIFSRVFFLFLPPSK